MPQNDPNLLIPNVSENLTVVSNLSVPQHSIEINTSSELNSTYNLTNNSNDIRTQVVRANSLPAIIPVVNVYLNETLNQNVIAVNAGATVAIQWDGSGTVSNCSASGDWQGEKTYFGGFELTPELREARGYSYTLTCTNSAGSASDTVVVNVGRSSSQIGCQYNNPACAIGRACIEGVCIPSSNAPNFKVAVIVNSVDYPKLTRSDVSAVLRNASSRTRLATGFGIEETSIEFRQLGRNLTNDNIADMFSDYWRRDHRYVNGIILFYKNNYTLIHGGYMLTSRNLSNSNYCNDFFSSAPARHLGSSVIYGGVLDWDEPSQDPSDPQLSDRTIHNAVSMVHEFLHSFGNGYVTEDIDHWGLACLNRMQQNGFSYEPLPGGSIAYFNICPDVVDAFRNSYSPCVR